MLMVNGTFMMSKKNNGLNNQKNQKNKLKR